MATLDWTLIAERLNAHLAKARLSSMDVARRSGVDRKTVDRLRAGHGVRPQTLQWIEQALSVRLGTPEPGEDPEVAPDACGGYRKAAVIGYAGEYTGYRRSFDTPDHIVANDLRVFWDDAAHALRFQERQHNRADSGAAYDYQFAGDVLIPPNLGVMHLVVRSGDGRIRLISTAMPREEQGTLVMKGFILTLNEIRDIGYYPVTSPIFFVKRTGGDSGQTGVLAAGDERFAWADGVLTAVERRFLPIRGS